MDKWLLKLILVFRQVFERQGIDTDRMTVIVETKLMMDKRRVYLNFRQREYRENKNQMNGVLISYGVLGLFMGLLIMAIPAFTLAMIFFHSYVLFMVAMTLITDFSTVLLDTADNQVILPTPVSGKTLFMARVVHILIYLVQFTMALSLLPIAATFYQYGLLPGLAMMITVTLTVLLAIFITYILYLLLLRYSNEQNLREMVTNFQILMSISFFLGYQIIPRVVNLSDLSSSGPLHWYAYLFPPVWMATTLDIFYAHSFDPLHAGMALLSLAVPVGSFWFLIKFLSPSFSRKLGAVATDPAGAGRIRQEKNQYRSISVFLSRIFCKKGPEEGIFALVWKITGRDKGFRLQFYPSLALIPVLLFIFVLGGGRNISTVWQNLPSSDRFLGLVYLPLMAASASILVSAFNEYFQASWIYRCLPVARPGELISGSAKALFMKYFLSFYLLMYALSVYIWGWQITRDFLFGLFNNLLCFLVFVSFAPRYLPFSRQPSTQVQTGKVVLMLVQFLVIGILIGIHYLLINLPIVMYLVMLLLAGACWLLLKEIQDIGWEKIKT